jgi:hypothetical protein
VTVTDSEAPLLVCPADISLTAASGSCDAVATWTAPVPTDNCTASGSITLTSTHASGSTFALGTTTVTYTATDAAGNTTTCSFTVTVTDTSAPTFTAGCGDLFGGSAIFGECYAVVNVISPFVTDNCGTVVLTNDFNGTSNASGAYAVGTTTIIWTATDAGGNTMTCTQTVTVTDDEAPTIACPIGVMRNNDIDVCGAVVTVPQLVATDNCGIASIVNSHNGTDNASGFYPVGNTTVIWTVTDVNGNSSQCSTLVTVNDTQAPSVQCPAPITVIAPCSLSATGADVIVPLPVITDNCGISAVQNSFNGTIDASGFYPIGTTTVTWTVRDVNFNTTVCSTTITVLPCCAAEEGVLSITSQTCPGDNVVVTATGFTTGLDYEHSYVVVDNATGLIVAINSTGVFTTTGAGSLAAGSYTVYSYTVFTSNPPIPTASIGSAISDIGATTEGCYAISDPGTVFVVLQSFPTLTTVSNISEGAGGTSPFAYNMNTITVYGGTQPYYYTWLNTGYVRYDIAPGLVDSDGDGVADVDGVIITVYYADNANWSVTVSDSNNCTTSELVFDNIPDGVNTILDIDDYTITAQTGTADNGAITIVTTGGDPSCVGNGGYSYQWSGPVTWTGAGTATGPTITNLPYGWYSVTVTDCNGQQTEGWYWVPRERRGRTKAEDVLTTIALSAAPNPFQSTTHIELSLSETEDVTVAVFNAAGQMVTELFKGSVDANTIQQLPFEADNLPSGMYVVVAITESGEREQLRLVLTK